MKGSKGMAPKGMGSGKMGKGLADMSMKMEKGMEKKMGGMMKDNEKSKGKAGRKK